MSSSGPPVSDEQRFVHEPGDAMEAEARLAVGGMLSIELRPAGGYRFSQIECSDPLVAEIVEISAEDEPVAQAVIVGRRAGTVTLRATTWFTGDRFGPPTRLWRMSLYVEP